MTGKAMLWAAAAAMFLAASLGVASDADAAWNQNWYSWSNPQCLFSGSVDDFTLGVTTGTTTSDDLDCIAVAASVYFFANGQLHWHGWDVEQRGVNGHPGGALITASDSHPGVPDSSYVCAHDNFVWGWGCARVFINVL